MLRSVYAASVVSHPCRLLRSRHGWGTLGSVADEESKDV